MSKNPITANFGCGEGIFFLHFILALIGFLILVVESYCFRLLYNDFHFLSHNPLSQETSFYMFNIGYLIRLSMPIWYTVFLDYSSTYIFWTLVVLLCYHVLTIIWGLKYYDTSIDTLKRTLNIISGFLTLASLFQLSFDDGEKDNLALVYIAILIPILIYAYFNLREYLFA
jgi:hypothetical protein